MKPPSQLSSLLQTVLKVSASFGMQSIIMEKYFYSVLHAHLNWYILQATSESHFVLWDLTSGDFLHY